MGPLSLKVRVEPIDPNRQAYDPEDGTRPATRSWKTQPKLPRTSRRSRPTTSVQTKAMEMSAAFFSLFRVGEGGSCLPPLRRRRASKVGPRRWFLKLGPGHVFNFGCAYLQSSSSLLDPPTTLNSNLMALFGGTYNLMEGNWKVLALVLLVWLWLQLVVSVCNKAKVYPASCAGKDLVLSGSNRTSASGLVLKLQIQAGE